MPWWETEIPTIRDKQHSYLRAHFPNLREDHEDLVGDTLLALTRQIRRRSSVWPPSWFGSHTTVSAEEQARFHKLAKIILKRRIADFFRKRKSASMPHLSIDENVIEALPDLNAALPNRRILLRKMLEVTLSVLDEMKPADRDLIALISEDDFRKALDARERQRLHRVRKRLKKEITRRLGAEVPDLLRIKL